MTTVRLPENLTVNTKPCLCCITVQGSISIDDHSQLAHKDPSSDTKTSCWSRLCSALFPPSKETLNQRTWASLKDYARTEAGDDFANQIIPCDSIKPCLVKDFKNVKSQIAAHRISEQTLRSPGQHTLSMSPGRVSSGPLYVLKPEGKGLFKKEPYDPKKVSVIFQQFTSLEEQDGAAAAERVRKSLLGRKFVESQDILDAIALDIVTQKIAFRFQPESLISFKTSTKKNPSKSSFF